jgi:SAM-dependent methyltransferase
MGDAVRGISHRAKGQAGEGRLIGAMHAASFTTDPKHFGFVLSRYKFVAKMLKGKNSVLEVGCGDTTGARIVSQFVGEVVGVDLEIYRNASIEVHQHNMVEGPFGGPWDAVYALDVLEHIDPSDEDTFLDNIAECLTDDGALIIGMPSKESQPYASALSKKLHINCKTEDELRETLESHFNNVFLFGMNDETLHTGFGPMTHYRLAVCTGKVR